MKKAKFARNLVQGDRVWLKPHPALGWRLNESADIFTISRTEYRFSGRGGRILVYAEERGDRPVAWLRSSAKVWSAE